MSDADVDCTAECRALPATQLALCRHSEDLAWAIPSAEGAPYRLVINNNGHPMTSLPPHVLERRIANVGREAYCHVKHMLEMRRVADKCGTSCIPKHVILAQGWPCQQAQNYSTQRSCAHLVHQISTALGRGEAHISPRNFLVPLQHTLLKMMQKIAPFFCGLAEV